MPQQKKRRPAAEALGRLQELASDLFTDDEKEDRENFINKGMEKGGYKPTLTWGDADESGDGGRGGEKSWFGDK